MAQMGAIPKQMVLHDRKISLTYIDFAVFSRNALTQARVVRVQMGGDDIQAGGTASQFLKPFPQRILTFPAPEAGVDQQIPLCSADPVTV